LARVTYSDYLERGADAALLVEEERAVLHARDREEADVLVARDLVRRRARRVVGRRHAVGRAHDVEVVRHQRLVGDEDEELELLEDGDLRDLLVRDDLLPAAGIAGLGDVHAVVGADGDHFLGPDLERCGAVDSGSAHRRGTAVICIQRRDLLDGSVQRRSSDCNRRLSRRRAVVRECSVGNDLQLERLGILRKKRVRMLRLRLDDLVAPVFPARGARGIERVRFTAQMSNLERIHRLVIFWLNDGDRRRSSLPGRQRRKRGASCAVLQAGRGFLGVGLGDSIAHRSDFDANNGGRNNQLVIPALEDQQIHRNGL
jgi:hypothetical protein